MPLLSTSAQSIDLAEDRERFDALLERFKIRRPAGRAVRSMEEAVQAAVALGYPYGAPLLRQRRAEHDHRLCGRGRCARIWP